MINKADTNKASTNMDMNIMTLPGIIMQLSKIKARSRTISGVYVHVQVPRIFVRDLGDGNSNFIFQCKTNGNCLQQVCICRFVRAALPNSSFDGLL